ncbi:unnamed protein product, partial [Didymodactylos carnosus]
MDLESAEYEQN